MKRSMNRTERYILEYLNGRGTVVYGAGVDSERGNTAKVGGDIKAAMAIAFAKTDQKT